MPTFSAAKAAEYAEKARAAGHSDHMLTEIRQPGAAALPEVRIHSAADR